MGACPHYPSRKSFNQPNFGGIITALTECIVTISGVGTTSFTLDPSGYASNFEGIVQCIEDLNFTLSGIQTGGGGGGPASGVAGGSGIYIVQSGQFSIVNVNYDDVFFNSVSGHLVGDANVTVLYSGTSAIISGTVTAPAPPPGGANVIVSGDPGEDFNAGDLWFDTNEGRLFVYASGNGITDPDWYQTNSEALALMSQEPPGTTTGVSAPARNGSLWFDTNIGSLFVYEVSTSGWYEVGARRPGAYTNVAPEALIEGEQWANTDTDNIFFWNGNSWEQYT